MDAIDFFCGAGGLTTAGVKAGLKVRVAVNHWRVAIDSHSANYPDIDHDCSDLSKVDVRKYPFPTVLLSEVKLGMGFEQGYKILGNKKEQVAQAGQAVCPDAAAWIIRRVVESLN